MSQRVRVVEVSCKGVAHYRIQWWRRWFGIPFTRHWSNDLSFLSADGIEVVPSFSGLLLDNKEQAFILADAFVDQLKIDYDEQRSYTVTVIKELTT